jgi:hypothetical protein
MEVRSLKTETQSTHFQLLNADAAQDATRKRVVDRSCKSS